MSLTPQDDRFLARALDLARQTIGLASPNPTVGCVLAHGDLILGEGAHLYEHRDHAEIAALHQAVELGHNVSGATAYVTLEPCAHHGRTGPCSDALISAGVSRCVVATLDPNPLVRGAGLAKLREAGVDVLLADSQSALALQARILNDAFAYFVQHRRPFVTLKAALSVDDMLAPPISSRTHATSHWVTGSAARADVHSLRHASDAILTGIGTVLADNPSLTDRTGLPRRRPLLRVVLDSNLRTPLHSTLVTKVENDLLILCSTHAAESRASYLRSRNVEVLRIPSDATHLDLQAVSTILAERNMLSVLVEAGSALNESLLRADFVDKLVLYYAEHEFGVDAIPFAAGFESSYTVQQRLSQMTCTPFESDLAPNQEDVRITGYLHNPWASIP